ncbi:hypothetical protein IG631_23384 [Alternaria alternata]|nr:hypothetical protein IG631_23384 [Alternaria alternata]
MPFRRHETEHGEDTGCCGRPRSLSSWIRSRFMHFPPEQCSPRRHATSFSITCLEASADTNTKMPASEDSVISTQLNFNRYECDLCKRCWTDASLLSWHKEKEHDGAEYRQLQKIRVFSPVIEGQPDTFLARKFTSIHLSDAGVAALLMALNGLYRTLT